jgi:hypothetical protein
MPDQQPPETSLVDFFAQSPLAKTTLELPTRDAGDDQHREVRLCEREA